MWDQLRVAYSHFLGGLHVLNQEHHHQNKVLFKNKNKIKQIAEHIFEILCKFNIPVTCSSVSKTARSCRFALHNIRKIRPFLRTTGLHWAKKAHVTPLFISLHWLPVAARIKFQTLMLAYRTATGSAPVYFHSLMTIYIPSKKKKLCLCIYVFFFFLSCTYLKKCLETWYYEHFLCLFTSLRWIALCIPQL